MLCLMRKFLILVGIMRPLYALYTVAILFFSAASPSFADSDLGEADFPQCILQLQDTAAEEGISKNTIEQVLAKASFVPRVIELDRRQPEFTTTFADYLNRRVTEDRVEKGRRLLAENKDLFAKVTKEYGVPAHYLVAFWGLETNYGSYFGKMPIVDSLATLACDPRRSKYFTFELISSLRILDEGAITPEAMQGSWAGAMGHMQFMPHVFLKYAVDADGDGRRDLWGSLADAMHSAGNFLQGIGWQRNQRWGREVSLPKDFDYQQIGKANRKTLAEWNALGVRMAVNGKALHEAPIKAALVVPAGHNGPKFLAYDNFNTIMGWNRSEYYAIAVGHLADRIAGGAALTQAPPSDALRLSREQIMRIQEVLGDKGFSVGEVDGIWGPATRHSLRQFQLQQKMIADGFIDKRVLKALGVSL